MATLSIWDTSHHKVIHGMVWQVQPQPSFDTNTFYGGYPKGNSLIALLSTHTRFSVKGPKKALL